MVVLSLDDQAMDIVKQSLEHELVLLQSKQSYLKEEIRRLEEKYDMASKEFIEKFDSGEIGDDQDYFEWWGLLHGLDATDKKLETTRSVLSSC